VEYHRLSTNRPALETEVLHLTEERSRTRGSMAGARSCPNPTAPRGVCRAEIVPGFVANQESQAAGAAARQLPSAWRDSACAFPGRCSCVAGRGETPQCVANEQSQVR
jgi:hypothetical protein